jgi:transglutaminase-like putative cysteine protease
MTVLSVRHRTEYKYRDPVKLGEHRLMSRPRDSHDLRLLDTALLVVPQPSELRWLHDVFGNSILIASFTQMSDSLVFESSFRAEHFPLPEQTIWIEPHARQLPFNYSGDDSADLGRSMERQYPDPEHAVDQWAKKYLDAAADRSTLDVLLAINQAIHSDFVYARREEFGVLEPPATLQQRSGSCRDFAVLMMEAVRSLGLAARFVSGYLYDERLIGANGGLVGGGATHAWLQVYLPGAGWVEFDPSNALVGGRNLIRVAVARNAYQASPLLAAFTGSADDLVSMNVTVEVTAQ